MGLVVLKSARDETQEGNTSQIRVLFRSLDFVGSGNLLEYC